MTSMIDGATGSVFSNEAVVAARQVVRLKQSSKQEDSTTGTPEMCGEFEPLGHERDGHPEFDVFRFAALGMMAVGIVHDFGNLMQVLSSAIDLIEKNLDHPARCHVEPYIRGAMQSADRATALSRQILGVPRVGELVEDFVHLDAALVEIRNPICWVAGPDVRVELALEAGLPAVFCSVRELENVVLNLVINARDAMPGGGRICISVNRCDFDEGPTVVLRVTDTGCGVPPETAQYMFQRFFSTKPLGRGTGLGLAMVGEFARRLGGSVQIDSAVNCGTSITLRLPACRD